LLTVICDFDEYPIGSHMRPKNPDEMSSKDHERFLERFDPSYPQMSLPEEIDKEVSASPEKASQYYHEFLQRSGLAEIGVVPTDPEYPAYSDPSPSKAIRSDPELLFNFNRVFETYYFQIRSAVDVIVDSAAERSRSSRGAGIVTRFKTAAIREALNLAKFQTETGRVCIPWWIENLVLELENNLTAGELELWRSLAWKLNQRPDFAVTLSRQSGKLQFDLSLLLRSFLKSLNTTLLNMSFRCEGEGAKRFFKRDWFKWRPPLLAHVWLFRDYYPLFNIPIVTPLSREISTAVKRMTHFEMIYIILHEIGHAALGHLDGPCDPEEAEFSADDFAIERLLRWKAPDGENLPAAIELLMETMRLAEQIRLHSTHSEADRAGGRSLVDRRRDRVRERLGLRADEPTGKRFGRTLDEFTKRLIADLPTIPQEFFDKILEPPHDEPDYSRA
jgi:hypothetical protein